MERKVQVFHGFDAADDAEVEYYASLTPQQRVDILLELVAAWAEGFGDAAQGLARVHRVVELSRS